jgi:hypothetical protein
MIYYYEIENKIIAELTDESFIITQPQDFLDLIGDTVSQNCNRLIIREKNFHQDFFRLHTGLAGEILQKVSNYNLKLAIIGDFTKYNSKNLHDFIRESNRGNRVFFVENREIGLSRLTGK